MVVTVGCSETSRAHWRAAASHNFSSACGTSAAYYGLYVVVADRHGDERGTRWLGGSCIIAPTGYLLAGPATPPGQPAQEALLLADVDPAASRDKSLGEYNHRLRDRREALYEAWFQPTSFDDPTPDRPEQDRTAPPDRHC